jgi:molybdate transport system substrate-binding protein
MRPLVIAACLLIVSTLASAQPLTIAAASDLQSALPGIALKFERETGQKVAVTFGSSGNFFTQIQNGAPFDLFLSADIDFPRRLEAAGQAERGSLYQYATGHLVLWARTDSGIDLRPGLGVLADARVRRIAIANPQLAPYGRAAVAVLRHEQLYDRVQAKLVIGDNIAQAAQFAQSGGADVGLIGLSVALSPAMKTAGAYVDIPESWYPPIEQAGVIVAASKQKALAQRFLDYLKSPGVIETLQLYGFVAAQPPAR